MAKRPKCPICALELKHEGEEPQVQYWMHNPRNLHEDILVTAHQACFNKVKLIHPSFGAPIQADWNNPTFPIINKGIVEVATFKEFSKLEIL